MVNKQEDLDILLRDNHPSTNVEVRPAVQLEPYTWKEIRLFLSSSFIDTHAERDALIKRVIPNLNRQLADRFIYIVPVDLRWGVLGEESKDCYAIQKTCLNQIDQCRQDVDEYPWFLGLRTDRYGWVQDKLLESGEYTNPRKYDWVKTLEEYEKQLSITSLECIHAALPPKKMRPGPTVLFYKRHIDNPEDIEENLKWVFDFEFVPEEAKLAAEIQNQYTKTSNAITYEKDKENLDKYLESLEHIKYSTYQCRYEKNGAWITGDNGKKKFGVGYVSGLEEFEKLVEKDLLDAIDKVFQDADISGLSAHVLENIPHENAVKEKASTFVGRSKLTEQIYQHCESEDVENSVLIIHGNPGCGKSALLADVSSKCLNNLRDRGEFVFAHSVDSCPGSNNLELMVRRLQVNLRSYRIGLGETKLSGRCPESTADLKCEHVTFLEESARKHPERLFIILIDAVNQFHDSMQSWKMWWLPSKDAPNNLRFVISTLNVENGTFDHARKMCPNAVNVPVEEMSYEDGKEMISSILERYNKKLTTTEDPFLGNQMKNLLSKNLSPLYLTASTQALRRFGIYENVRNYIDNLPDTIPALFDFLLDSWLEEYGERFIRGIACIICLSKDGLLENEINDILLFIEQEEKVDYQCSFSRVYDALCGFFAAGGGGYLRFFHDQLNKVVNSKFLTPTFEQEIHGWLVKFHLHNIQPQLIEHRTVEPAAYYPHCLEQVVYHQLKSIETTEGGVDFTDTLRNIYFVRERVILQQENLLQHDYIQAVRRSIHENEKKALRQWAKFAQLYSPHIRKFPEWGYNMAMNQPSTSYVALDTSKLREPTTCVGYPLYWSNVPPAEDEVVLKYTSGRYRSCVASTSEINLICIGGDTKAFLYEMDSGVLLHQVEMKPSTEFSSCFIESLYLSTKYNTFWTGNNEGYVSVWSGDTGGEEWKSEKIGTEDINGIEWIEGIHGYVACGTRRGTIACFDEQNRNIIKSWSTGSEFFFSVTYCYHGNRNLILSGHTNVIKCWSVEGELMEIVQVGEGHVECISAHPSKEDVLAFVLKYHNRNNRSKRGTTETVYCVKQMNVSTGEVICTIPDLPDTYEHVVVLYDTSGERLLCVDKDKKTIMVYGEDGKLQNKLKGHSKDIRNMCLVPGRNEILTAAYDGSMLFTLPTTPDGDIGEENSNEELIVYCEFLPGGDEFVTLSEEGKLQKWVTSSSERSTSVDIEGARGAVVHPARNYIVVYTEKYLYCFNSVNLEQLSSCNVIPEDEYDDKFAIINDVNISPDGLKCVVAIEQQRLCAAVVYDISNISEIKRSISYEMSRKNVISSCDIHHDNERVMGAGSGGIEVWNLSTGKLISKHEEYCVCYAKFLHESDRILYISMFSSQTCIMDMKDGHVIEFDSKFDWPPALKLTRNETQLITGEMDKTIRLHDTDTGNLLYTFIDHRSVGFYCLAVHPFNNTVITSNKNGMLYILKNSRN